MLPRDPIPAIAVLALLLASCTNPINPRTAATYYDAGYAAVAAGDWPLARTNFRRAIQTADVEGANPRRMSALWYEYGRASGVLCDWAAAESALNSSYRLNRQFDGPTVMSLYELGRINYARSNYPAAVGYFARVRTGFDRNRTETSDPVGYADFLDEYADALEQTSGASEAATLRSRAAELRQTFPGMAGRTEKTPYGTQCQATGQ